MMPNVAQNQMASANQQAAPGNLQNPQNQAPVAQNQPVPPQEPSPPPNRPRNIFDELLESSEDIFARLIAKEEMIGCCDKDEIHVGVEHSVNKFIQKAQVVELFFNQRIAKVTDLSFIFTENFSISANARLPARRFDGGNKRFESGNSQKAKLDRRHLCQSCEFFASLYFITGLFRENGTRPLLSLIKSLTWNKKEFMRWRACRRPVIEKNRRKEKNLIKIACHDLRIIE